MEIGSSDLEQVLYYELYCLEGNLKGHFLRRCVTISSTSSIHLNKGCVIMIYKHMYKYI
jgi:hypothetical protein